jgi:hypothetical protein
MKLAGTVIALAAVAGLGMPAVATTLAAGSNQTHTSPPAFAIKRSTPNGRTDVIKAMGNVRWSDIELKR